MLCALGTLLGTFAARCCRRNCTFLLEKEINNNDGSQTLEMCTSGDDNYPVPTCAAQGQAIGRVCIYVCLYIIYYVYNYVIKSNGCFTF